MCRHCALDIEDKQEQDQQERKTGGIRYAAQSRISLTQQDQNMVATAGVAGEVADRQQIPVVDLP